MLHSVADLGSLHLRFLGYLAQRVVESLEHLIDDGTGDV